MRSTRHHQTLQRDARPVAAVAARTDAPADYPIGAHLVTPRLGYSHHGIYVGNGRVVHYAGLSRTLFRGPVEEVSLERFAGGRAITVKAPRQARFGAADIVARARSRLGEDAYRVTTNNCEHFCEWCIAGEGRSEQVERILGRPRELLLAMRRMLGETRGAGQRALLPAAAR